MTPDLPATWRARAADLERFAPPAAEAFRVAADELDAELREAAGEALTLSEAAEESGYAPRTLRQMVAEGKLPNAGRRNAPRVRRADLPRRPSKASPNGYDAAADAARLMARAR
jgi:hypothetical protein